MSDHQTPEIVIIKRHARHEDDHHGGAWKIAFADFMTAMMALFLVLWLVSSTSEKTKRTVAQYFNPVKLVDMTTLKKGFRDPKETEMGSGRSTEPLPPEKEASEPEPRAAKSDAHRKASPQENAQGVASMPREGDRHPAVSPAPAGPEGAAKVRVRAGDGARAGAEMPRRSTDAALAFKDPFAIVSEDVELESTADSSPSASEVAKAAAPPGTPGEATVSPDGTTAAAARKGSGQTMEPSAKASRPDGQGSRDVEFDTLLSELRDVDGRDTTDRSAPRLVVESTDEGVLISLTDSASDVMFAIGSAEPRPKTVEVMRKIARLLATRPGTVVIRGHTDARPYRSGVSDNWRLSTARAHAAHDVLVRGGLDTRRIERLEGYADHKPKVAGEPLAPENRRIEILLRKEKS